jgi:8-oxo-dGTP pyrophosphatase MutT (NUDIX family)
MCVLHNEDGDVNVLMVRRGSTARFMAGAWAFPGGVVDPDDHGAAALASMEGLIRPELGPWLAAGFREVVEETGVWLTDDPFVALPNEAGVFATARAKGLRFTAARTAYFANWITPTMSPVRFDARFFIAAIDAKVVPIPDGREIDAAEFVAPIEALQRAGTGEWLVPFPTQRALHQLAAIPSVAAVLREWQRKTVLPIQPRMRVADDGSLEVVAPGDPGFDDLEDVRPDPDALAKGARVAADRGRPIAEMARDPD